MSDSSTKHLDEVVMFNKLLNMKNLSKTTLNWIGNEAAVEQTPPLMKQWWSSEWGVRGDTRLRNPVTLTLCLWALFYLKEVLSLSNVCRYSFQADSYRSLLHSLRKERIKCLVFLNQQDFYLVKVLKRKYQLLFFWSKKIANLKSHEELSVCIWGHWSKSVSMVV